MLFATLALAPLASVLPAAPAMAQTGTVTVGMQVVDVSGGLVGTVNAIRGNVLTIKTDKHEVALPRESFTLTAGKLLFGMTQAELNAATEKTLAEAAAQMVAGAEVKGTGGAHVGTLESVNNEVATIKLDSGRLVQIPRSGVVAGPEGIVIGVTAAQLEAQLEASSPQPE